MSLRINTNVAALNAHRNMLNNDNKLSSSLERLSTGLRINKAADDASGMSIADALRAQHLGIGQAIRNANDGISIVQTADGALQESINIINTIKTKAIQAASDGQTSVTRTVIQNDINKLMEELSTIAKTTSYNGQKLLSGAFTNKAIQIGAFANETANLSIGSTEATKMGHITQANLSLASASGGEVQLTITSSITGEQLTLNKIDIQSNNSATNGMGALADEVNRYSALTGIKATAVINTTSTTAIAAGTTGSGFAINGINIGAITTQTNDSDGALVSAINGKTAEHGVTAAINNDGTLKLTSSDGRSIAVTGSISDVFGSTASQMSTQGYLALSQKGVSQFQINGIGAGATGANFTISSDVTTVDDSVLASGSTIKTGSKLTSGTIIGGDMLVESSIASTSLDYDLKAGTTLYYSTQVAKGTELGGSVTVGGDVNTTAGGTAIEQDMLVTSGSTLEAGSVLGLGTVVTTAFSSSASGSVVNYSVGDTLTSAVTLSADLTAGSNMTLKYNATSSQNTVIHSGTILASGTQLGVELEIGKTYDSGAANQQITTAATTTSDVYLTSNLVMDSSGAGTVKAGSLLVDNSELILASDASGTMTWTGPTLITDSGTLEYGDTVNRGQIYTLSGDQVVSGDIELEITGTTGSNTIGSGSILQDGFTMLGQASGGTGELATLSTATLSNDMTLKAGSELATGSKLLSGSTLGDATYVMGGSISSSGTDITTYARTELKANSLLQANSILAEGSTVGGSTTVKTRTSLASDMTLSVGSILTSETVLKQGTTINQNMTLYDASSGNGTKYTLSAGDVLTQDMWVNTDSGSATITLSAEMTLKKDSYIGTSATLAINTVNAGTVGLSSTTSYRLSDLNVLTQEGAQRAIDIAEATLSDLDKTRSGLGSVQNQLVSTISNLSVTKTNIQASESAIRDVDFAEEASTFSKLQLLAQTGSYALAQANAASNNLLSLLK
ncbi:MAG: flagellin [Deltaproteobacteria bacterium]|nr:flagellin [Deltaproteobacteria bacterium]